MNTLLAIDAGTGSVRAVLFDLEGSQLGVAQREWTHLSEEGVPNSMGFDFRKNWALCVECIKEVIQKTGINPKNIKALSASSMREGIVLYDKDGNELWGVANVDARAGNEVRFLKENFRGLEERQYAISGQTFALGALPRLLWVKNNLPSIYEKTATISMISDWVLAKLSGVIASEPSNAGTAGAFSLADRNWAKDQAREVGVRDDLFPMIYESGEVIGRVSAKASKECNLSTETLVVSGGGDVQLGSAGLGVVEEGECAVLGGTFWQQTVNIKSQTPPPSNMDIRVNPHVIKGLSQAEGITFFSGLIMRWFRDAFCNEEKQEALRVGKDAYTLLEERAKSVPVGSNGIVPIFSDEMRYGKWYHAAPSFINLGIDPELYNKYSMFRSLQENACIVSAINLEKTFAFSGIRSQAIVFAGGASKGELWSQILSDVSGLPVHIPKVTEATALGAAFSAGVGAGVYHSIKEAAKSLVVWEREYQPSMQNHSLYNELKHRWREIYARELKLVDEGLTTSMWKAPGI